MSKPPETRVADGLPIEIKPIIGWPGDLKPILLDADLTSDTMPTEIGNDLPASPGFGAAAGLGAAFELKYLIDPQRAGAVERWAALHLRPDHHGDRGRYRVTSVYCDTPQLDVFHRSPGYRRAKFRLRRYDASTEAFLERKRKRGTQVTKRRTPVHADSLPLLGRDVPPPAWAGEWFLDRIRRRDLHPTACVSYHRTAFFGMADDRPIRMTIDRDLVGSSATDWHIPHLTAGTPLLHDGVLVEIKFHLHMPALFRDLLQLLPTQTANVSKYRRCVGVCRIGGASLPDAAGMPMGNA